MKIAFRACLIALLALLQLVSAADTEVIAAALKNELYQKIVQLENDKKSLEAQVVKIGELLKVSVAQIRLENQYEQMVCRAPDVMQARMATLQLQQEVDKLSKGMN